MTPEKAAIALQALQIQTGWHVIVVSRSDVAERWYPDVEEPLITDEQWKAVQATQTWDLFEDSDELTKVIDTMIRESIDDAVFDLVERAHDY